MSNSKYYQLWTYMNAVAIIATLALLVVTAVFLYKESSLGGGRERLTGQAAFVAGSIGTEFIPLPVLEVISDLDPEGFPAPTVEPKTGAWKGGWVDLYGFLENRGDEETIPSREPALKSLLREDLRKQLPIGFSISYLRPTQPDPSPVAFVGLACAGCHSSRLPDRGPGGKLVYGAGNNALDLIGFFEAFRGLLIKRRYADVPALHATLKTARSITEGPDLDASVDPEAFEYVLSLSNVERARAQRTPPLHKLTTAQRLMVWYWIVGSRTAALSTLKKYDLPSTPSQLRSPAFNSTGPGRTKPFVTLVNSVLDLPARDNHGYSKIPAVFREGDRIWSQFDGSVRDHNTRSGLAAMTSGGSVHNLSGLGVADHVIEAASYTRTALVGPRWEQIFGQPSGGIPPNAGDDDESARLDATQRIGRDVYRKYCASCHGRPDPGRPNIWMTNHRDDRNFGKIFPAVNPATLPGAALSDWIGPLNPEEWELQHTDPERVAFRDSNRMPYILFTYFDQDHPHKSTREYFPLAHPLSVARDGIRNSGGYVSGPIDSAFSRAPYLHNGSVPTLAQLINLEPRPERFLRGQNAYDRDGVGLGNLPGPGGPKALYWMFDASQPGNLKVGHHYPWAPGDPKRNADELKALLAYLKSL